MTSEKSIDAVGVVGLGRMGLAYAKNLIAGGFDVHGFDVNTGPAAELAKAGGHVSQSPAEVAAAAKIVLVALPNVAALEEVTSAGDGLVKTATDGLIVVEMSTLPIGAKTTMSDLLQAAGAVCLDAPVSGTGLQADKAEIVVYASGDPNAIDASRAVFDAISAKTFDVGGFGNGSRMKFIANLLVSVNNLATAEAFVLGDAAGLSRSDVLEVISAGVGSSRIFEIRGPMIVADDYPAAARLEMFIKDVTVIQEFAQSVGAPTPLLDAVLPWYEGAVAAGLGEFDAAVLARHLAAQIDSGAAAD